MWLLLAIGCMVLALKVFSFSFTLALVPFAAGCWCFSKSNRSDLDDFMAFSFFFALIGFAVLAIIKLI
ncbi:MULTISPECIES: hypothetical protein [Aeromonas]|uniref:hypothetical protein n=1 Tax=Aeromonas TaxID=642 RepID=UPI0005747CA4|nr:MULTISPECIES: hypothetical protein [Aeromonas]KHN50283.1 hypothetical protein OI72_21055 [Aeromonas hydrophila]MBL0560361.1 hypothetical protein [Aeromonas hydrophila]MBM0511402.1 hypothetical protein [Aeromonas hydrophila]MBW3770988.1 hypothetical protein [Aeromonas hydrophila]MCX4103556.1 hypothetical protein [Aeromonas hydrophila]